MQNISARITSLSVALGILTACSGGNSSTAGITQYITGIQSSDGTKTATLQPGSPPPGTGSGPSVTVDASGATIPGGTKIMPITCSSNCTRVIVSAQGTDGYYDLSGLPAGTTQAIVTSIAQTAPQTFTLGVSGGIGAAVGPTTDVPITVTKVGTGDVQVNVSWDVDTDVDLHVVEPSGEEVYYGNTTSATGGTLDLDSNAGCTLDHKRAENITWPTGKAPTGTYHVIVDSFSLCAFTQVNYVVTVNLKGKAPQTFLGSFTSSDSGSTCWPSSGTTLLCGTLVTTFSLP